ncbi:CWC16 protein [Tuber borchii]|uniref:Splicing factor YJU2 n=1 Tax=Tuber borchii TaxID=42251 RepID=A0A2T6ZYU5_TUBBO|nr:CWC16 protein [Tuber borchii]
MSERKVLQKYYPPDFDPSKIVRHKGPKPTGPKQQTVRLMAPFSMKCLNCGEFIYKGRKFNARKEHSGEKYYNISIFRFYIRCTRCSSEVTFKTDPKNMDYTCEKGAIRNFEPWRDTREKDETEEERLNRLEEEENESAMAKLETKTLDSKREMQIADALDEIRTRNARNERFDSADVLDTLLEVTNPAELELMRQEEEDAELARKAFRTEEDKFVRRVVDDGADEADISKEEAKADIPSFKKTVKRRRDMGAVLGIKKKLKPLV